MLGFSPAYYRRLTKLLVSQTNGLLLLKLQLAPTQQDTDNPVMQHFFPPSSPHPSTMSYLIFYSFLFVSFLHINFLLNRYFCCHTWPVARFLLSTLTLLKRNLKQWLAALQVCRIAIWSFELTNIRWKLQRLDANSARKRRFPFGPLRWLQKPNDGVPQVYEVYGEQECSKLQNSC